MRDKVSRVARTLIAVSCLPWAVTLCNAQETKKAFTVADDIAFTNFGGPQGKREFTTPVLLFSPDANYFAVYTSRGQLDVALVQDSLRFYRSADIGHFLEHYGESQPPSPIWVVNRSDKTGPVIKHWRWLADSSGVAFLESTADDNQHLVLADLWKKTTEPLTSARETVVNFDIADRNHYVYTITDPTSKENLRAKTKIEREAPAIVGTGRTFDQLVFLDNPDVVASQLSSVSYLWAVVDGKRFEVKHDGAPLVPDGDVALSPDGSSVVTALPVADIPLSWETLYPPPFASYAHRIHAGRESASHYVRITLQTGSVQALTDAPISGAAGWESYGSPSWSRDGQGIVLPGTFIQSRDNVPSRPCVAVVEPRSNTRSCVEMLKAYTENGWKEGDNWVKSERFAGGDKQRVMVSTYDRKDWSLETTEYSRTAGGTWQISRRIKGDYDVGRDGLEIAVQQGLNEPPRLVATSKHTSRVIWDPNPQLKNIELGEASLYTVKNKEWRDWRGVLYKPGHYIPGYHYPLVIQTHGFTAAEFIPSGAFPTAFAARALAAAGLVVLQVGEDCPLQTPSEGPCAASGYEAAAKQLVSEGLVDPEKIGIIGFSRTCFKVMYALTFGAHHIKAASITDGVIENYLQYMLYLNLTDSDSVIGAKPFGEGLQQWLKRSPGFNLDKVTAPLLVVGSRPFGVENMWEPYAGLRYLNKPVDLMVLNTNEHPYSNPGVRMASQGGSVDWFRFWLQDYEDPDPKKKEQYERWRGLKKMQDENEAKAKAAAVN